MKNVQIKKLELTNYRNIPYAVYEFNGNSKIIGDNRIGKSNTLESIYWLLTGKLMDGSSEISVIKPLTDTKLEVSVKATFDVEGKEVTFEKKYKENWVKKRGNTELEMKGHQTTLLHNNIKQSSLNDYERLVYEDLGFTQDNKTKIDFMQMLLNPFYLGNIGEERDWTELRSFIIQLIGDVSDEDVFRENSTLLPIKKDLETASGRIDQVKKKYAGELDGLNTNIVSDDALIKMLEQTPNPTEDEVAVAEKAIREHEQKISAIQSSVGVDIASMELSNNINKKKTELAELTKKQMLESPKHTEKLELQKQINEQFNKQSEFLTKRNEIQIKIGKLESDLSVEKANLEHYKDSRIQIIRRIKDTEYQLANIVIVTVCPVCKKPYTQEEIAEHRKISETSLNELKDKYIEDGKKCRSLIDELSEKIKALEVDKEKAETELIDIETELKTIVSKRLALEEKERNISAISESSPEIDNLKEEINQLEEDLKVSRDNFFKGSQDKQTLIDNEHQAMIPFKKVINDREYFIRQQERLSQVQKQKKEHQDKLADTEQKKELLNKFIYTKLRLLDINVHRVFGNIKFQLIKENINGGFDPVCKPYIYDPVAETSTDTTWRNGSKSERIVTGIAICEKIKEKLNLPNLPYLIDEGGEMSNDTLSNRLKTDSQIICVKVVDDITKPLVQDL